MLFDNFIMSTSPRGRVEVKGGGMWWSGYSYHSSLDPTTLVLYFMFLYSLFPLPLMIVTHDGASVMLVPILSCSSTRTQSRAHFLPILSWAFCVCLLSIHSEFIFVSRPFTRALTVLYTLSPSSPAPHITHIPVHRYTYTPESIITSGFDCLVARWSRSG